MLQGQGLEMVAIGSRVFGHESMVRGAQVQCGICSSVREIGAERYWQVIREWRDYNESFKLSLSLSLSLAFSCSHTHTDSFSHASVDLSPVSFSRSDTSSFGGRARSKNPH